MTVLVSLEYSVRKPAEKDLALEHDDANSTAILLIDLVPPIYTSCYRVGLVVIQVKVQLSISCTEFLFFEEQGIFCESKSIEDVEFRVFGENEGVFDKGVVADFDGGCVSRLLESGF